VPVHARAYQRSPLEPFPAERVSRRRSSFSSRLTASAQVSFTPRASVTRKSGGTRSTYPWSPASKKTRAPRQLITLTPRQPGAYPGGSSRLRFCCLHKRIIARRLPPVEPAPSRPAAGHNPKCGCRTRSVVQLTIHGGVITYLPDRVSESPAVMTPAQPDPVALDTVSVPVPVKSRSPPE